ncbi:hypothetical protein B0T21DRAFT_353249 [Apiosordaria backusii]|uniref:Zn(2)-C6 fungal-type domain-containing protein n=1 Tax=Apiosordaria backusii TaxID=314023 RepID=A0AA39ZV38_9PEZI|nr:hypothetical protein B0T21DRAFT_353249 [Apiosordaria backusii]
MLGTWTAINKPPRHPLPSHRPGPPTAGTSANAPGHAGAGHAGAGQPQAQLQPAGASSSERNGRARTTLAAEARAQKISANAKRVANPCDRCSKKNIDCQIALDDVDGKAACAGCVKGKTRCSLRSPQSSRAGSPENRSRRLAKGKRKSSSSSSSSSQNDEERGAPKRQKLSENPVKEEASPSPPPAAVPPAPILPAPALPLAPPLPAASSFLPANWTCRHQQCKLRCVWD